MSIFSSMRQFTRQQEEESSRSLSQNKSKEFDYPIFDFSGTDISNRIIECSLGENTALYFDHLAAIAKAKALKHKFEQRNKDLLEFKDLIIQLWPDNPSIAEETVCMLEKAIDLENYIYKIRRKYRVFEVEIDKNEILDLIDPVYHGEDAFIDSAIDFKLDAIKELFLEDYLLFFSDPIEFGEMATHVDVPEKDLEYLNQAIIYKSKTIDLIKLLDDYMFCVDVNKRFNDGDRINTDKAWIFGQKKSALKVVLVY